MDICEACGHPIPTHQTEEQHDAICDALTTPSELEISQMYERVQTALFDLERLLKKL
jgi:hypothetical protein